jgi:hypothetical protein
MALLRVTSGDSLLSDGRETHNPWSSNWASFAGGT